MDKQKLTKTLRLVVGGLFLLSGVGIFYYSYLLVFSEPCDTAYKNFLYTQISVTGWLTILLIICSVFTFFLQLFIEKPSIKTSLPFILFVLILLLILLASLNNATSKKSLDARRITDIKQLQLALELYHDAYNDLYTENLNELTPRFIPVIPKDPLDTYKYEYSVSSDRKSYAFKTMLVGDGQIDCKQKHSGTYRALQNDIDGIILGLQCDDPAFCVSN